MKSGKVQLEYVPSTLKLWDNFNIYLIWLIDVRHCFVEQYVQIFSCVIIYDV